MEEGLVATTEPETTPTPPTVSSFIGEDGSLKEGWQGVLDEDYRDDAILSTVKNFKHLAKITVDTKRMMGKDKISVPTETSSEVEWEEYYKAGGRPETVADYGLKVPDDIPAEISELVFPTERLSAWQDRFFKAGISKKAADQFIAAFGQDVMLDFQNQKNAEEAEMTELTGGLARDWGNAYDQKIHFGNMAIEEGTKGDEGLKQRVVVKIQKDPDLTRFTSNLGSKFAEGKPPNFSSIPTPADYQSQINDLMASPVLLDSKSTAAQRKVITDKIMVLRANMAKTKTTP